MNISLPQLQIEFEIAPDSAANLLACLTRAGAPVARSCGGEGVCGTCRVEIEGDHIPEPNALEARLLKRARGATDQHARERCACLVTPLPSSKMWVIRTRYW